MHTVTFRNNGRVWTFIQEMIILLLTIDLLLLTIFAAAYSVVSREAQRGRDIVLEMTNYRHLAEDMLPLLRNLILISMLFFACLCCMQAGQSWMSSH